MLYFNLKVIHPYYEVKDLDLFLIHKSQYEEFKKKVSSLSCKLPFILETHDESRDDNTLIETLPLASSNVTEDIFLDKIKKLWKNFVHKEAFNIGEEAILAPEYGITYKLSKLKKRKFKYSTLIEAIAQNSLLTEAQALEQYQDGQVVIGNIRITKVYTLEKPTKALVDVHEQYPLPYGHTSKRQPRDVMLEDRKNVYMKISPAIYERVLAYKLATKKASISIVISNMLESFDFENLDKITIEESQPFYKNLNIYLPVDTANRYKTALKNKATIFTGILDYTLKTLGY